MAKIGLERMEFYAFHGYYEYERRIGNRFVIDVMVEVDIDGDPDEKIANTFNYELIYKTCKKFMKKRFLLLETLAHHIATDLKYENRMIKEIKIRIEKINPAMGGKIGRAVVEMVF